MPPHRRTRSSRPASTSRTSASTFDPGHPNALLGRWSWTTYTSAARRLFVEGGSGVIESTLFGDTLTDPSFRRKSNSFASFQFVGFEAPDYDRFSLTNDGTPRRDHSYDSEKGPSQITREKKVLQRRFLADVVYTKRVEWIVESLTALGYEVSASWTPLDTGIPRIVILPFYYGGPRPVGAHCRYVFIDDLKSFFEAKKHLL